MAGGRRGAGPFRMSHEPCPYCLNDVAVTWWDHVIGLAVLCRNCGAYAGPRWSTTRLVIVSVASLFLNALVLFFVTRPVRAFFLIVMYGATVAALWAAFRASTNEAFVLTAASVVIIGPACLAASEYHQHRALLRRRPLIVVVTTPEQEVAGGDADDAGMEESVPRFAGTNELERQRNELEIAIFHHKDRLRLTANMSYFVATLQALLAVPDKQWSELTISLLLVGLAYSVKAHESRVFAGLYAFFGMVVACNYGYRYYAGGAEPPSMALPAALVFQGVVMIATTVSLRHLRRLRAGIPLEEAAHLKGD